LPEFEIEAGPFPCPPGLVIFDLRSEPLNHCTVVPRRFDEGPSFIGKAFTPPGGCHSGKGFFQQAGFSNT